MNNRVIKIFFGASTGLYVSLVCFNNITDYGSNFQFVKMVSGMQDVLSKEKSGWRSINREALHHAMYLFIIAWEIAISVLIITGVFRMITKLKSGTDEF